MSPDPLATNPLTSQLGRQWLLAADGYTPLDDQPNGTDNRTYVVAIPDVGSPAGTALSGTVPGDSTNSNAIDRTLTESTEQRLTDLKNAVADLANSQPEVHRAVDVEVPREVSSDLSEKPADWTDNTEPNKTSRTGNPDKSQSGSQNEAIETLVEAILERFPLGDPAVIQFVGSEPNSHIDETCARVGSALADRKIGRVLLLDSDIAGQALSKASGVLGEPGISDVVNKAASWESVIYGRSATGLDFLASGNEQFHHPEGKSRLRQAVSEMKREYQFICISAGDAHSSSARMWNDVSDGSYLLVSLKNSNESYAKSAVAELQASGARLLGCVVTDVD
jgi:Mrp family chromosome partitioning ATPase